MIVIYKANLPMWWENGAFFFYNVKIAEGSHRSYALILTDAGEVVIKLTCSTYNLEIKKI